MFGYLIILFTVVPALELAILIKVGTIIGVSNTLLFIIFTGVLGAYLARYQGFVTYVKIQENLNKGLMPSNELIDGLLILVGGVVLLTPGFVTDALGFVLLIPWTRSLVKRWVIQNFERMIQRGEAVSFTSSRNDKNRFDDIDI